MTDRRAAWVRRVVVLFAGALMLASCGSNDERIPDPPSGDGSGGVEFFDATDPESGTVYRCLWRYATSGSGYAAGAGLWCERNPAQ